MRDDSKVLAALAAILFRVWEKFFKFLSWLFMVGLLRAIDLRTEDKALEYLYIVAMVGFTLTLLMYSIWLIVRDPTTYNVPKEWSAAARTIQIIVALGLFAIISTPYLILDQIIEALANAR